VSAISSPGSIHLAFPRPPLAGTFPALPWLPYMLSRGAAKSLLAAVGRLHVIRGENSAVDGPCLLAANHISHFDPPILSVAARRKIDWMAMTELFENRLVAVWLRAIDSFPTDRLRPDRTSVRTALRRLAAGRMVGIFPEAGIRDGPGSVLEGAPIRPGIGTLAQLSGAPILPCAIVGTDRFYNPRNWVPLRRVPVWVAFGGMLRCDTALPKARAREQIESELARAMQALHRELRERFSLTAADLPQPPARRKGRA
jgi:1-acyl-sn-glycerol-3-phosphate acyltransferase